jgi:hypothetical protein
MKPMKLNYISLLAVALACLTAGTAPADVLTLQPVDDSTISTITGEPGTPFGNADQLAMTGWLDIGARRPLLKFDLSPIPDGWTVLSAVLTLQLVYIHPTSWPTFASEVWRMPNDNWVETTVTWNSYDQTGAVAVATNILDAAIGPRVWNISIADWNYAADLLDEAVTFELRWSQELSQHFKYVGYSSKEGTVTPTLRIEFIPRLTITRTNELIIVSWPAPAAGWLLERTNVLSGVSAPWPPVSPPYQTNGNTLSVTFTNTPAVGSQFFRLHKP